MSFFIYQRSDPRYPDWLPLTTQQLRLRNLIQIIGINLNIINDDQVYYTLHMASMSAPFFTSETQHLDSKLYGNFKGGSTVTWREIEPRQISNVKLSAAGLIIRIWSTCDGSKPLVSWGVHFKGLLYLGIKGDLNTQNFAAKSILIRLPCGYFTAAGCLTHLSESPQRFISMELSNGVCRKSYSVKNLAALHRIQRSLLEELELARRLRFQIGIYGFSTESTLDNHSTIPSPLTNNDSSIQRSTSISKVISQLPITTSYHMKLVVSGRALQRVQQEKNKIKWKEEIETKRLLVSLLRDEKGRAEGRVHRLKQKTISIDDVVGDLMNRVHCLGRERDRLRDYKNHVHEMKQRLAEKQAQLNLRKKQLISELLFVYPLQLIEGSKRFSIGEVQLPNAEDYGNENGAQISVALGYTGHLVAMLSFFLGIPLRYPIKHFGSRSRIIDHITTQIPNKEREFPLYFRGREDVYSKYAVYLLNKNIAQLRWYCGLSTQDLRASLPNLYNVLTSRLIIPGWPPCPGDTCEVAQELTEEIGQTLFLQNDSSLSLSLSLDGGLDQITATPRTGDDLHMQSWFRSSYSDLEGIGGGNNSVPSGEIYHGSRAQNRFLSGWKKKTYTEPEQIDPQWLTNSLNLEFDLGRRPSITPPVPFIVVSSSNESTKSVESAKSRKRRYGRVEQTNILQQNNICDNNKNFRQPTFTTSSTTTTTTTIITSTMSTSSTNTQNSTNNSNKLGTMDAHPSASVTPNGRMVEVEQQIKDNERRKSVCDVSHASHSSPTLGHSSSGNFILNSLPSSKGSPTSAEFLELPQTEDWPTTDEEKLDDSIADVVRKISLMEMQLNRLPPQQKDSSIESEEEHLNSSLPPPSLQNPSQSSQLCTVQENEDPGNVSSTTITSLEEDELGNQSEESTPTVIQSPSEESRIMMVEDGEEINNQNTNLKEISSLLLSEISCDKDRTIEARLRDMQVGDTHTLDCSMSEQQQNQQGEGGGGEQVFRNSETYSSPTTTTTNNNTENEDDPSSLWLRTEALLSSQSFNMVRKFKHSQ